MSHPFDGGAAERRIHLVPDDGQPASPEHCGINITIMGELAVDLFLHHYQVMGGGSSVAELMIAFNAAMQALEGGVAGELDSVATRWELKGLPIVSLGFATQLRTPPPPPPRCA